MLKPPLKYEKQHIWAILHRKLLGLLTMYTGCKQVDDHEQISPGDVRRMVPQLKQVRSIKPRMTSAFRGHAVVTLALAACIGAICLSSTPSRAQDVQRIAAIVNDEVISRFDVEQRMRLVISTSNLTDSKKLRRRLRQQILRSLVDESLQLQAAKRHSIRVNKSDIKRAYQFIEQQNKVPSGGLIRFLKAKKIPVSALESQINADISWSKLIRRRLSRNVQIGEEEINEVLARLKASAGQSEHKVSEIFLPIDTPEQEEEVRRASIGLLKQLRDGASFAAMARQFSRGATAAQGGAVGWVKPGQLDTGLDLAIIKLDAKAISEPIQTVGGYYLIYLHERRKITPGSRGSVKLGLKQILLPLGKNAGDADYRAKMQLAATVAESVQGCDGVEGVAKELQSNAANDLGTVALKDLPGPIAAAVKDVAVGRFGAPIRGKGAVMLLMVCSREETKGKGPDRESISNTLARQRLAMLAQRYLRDLRRSAVVELR